MLGALLAGVGSFGNINIWAEALTKQLPGVSRIHGKPRQTIGCFFKDIVISGIACLDQQNKKKWPYSHTVTTFDYIQGRHLKAASSICYTATPHINELR